MFNRAEIVDDNFINKIVNGDLPKSLSTLNALDLNLTKSEIIDLFFYHQHQK